MSVFPLLKEGGMEVPTRNEVLNGYTAVNPAIWHLEPEAPISGQKFAAALRKAGQNKNIGPKGVRVLRVAYALAKEAAGADPTRPQIRAQILKVIGSLANERAKDRVNDGRVDAREAGGVEGELAAAVYAFVGTT